MTKKPTVQTRYTEGDEYHQILLNRTKKDRLYKSGKPNLSDADRRIVLESTSKVFLSPKLRTVFQEVFNKYDINGSVFEDQLLAFGKQILSNNGVGNSEEQEKRFDCNKLCKKCKICTSNAMFDLGEILALICYVGKYPYEWTTPDGRTVRLCKMMFFARDFPHDAENPHPKCNAKQKDVPMQLPKDRIIRDPQFCWTCYKLRKQERERKREAMELRKISRYDEFAGQPRVDWYASNPY